MAQLDILRNPVRIGHVETRNRIYLPAHQPSFAPPEYGAYLAERARGGVGLIVTHGFHVHASSARAGVSPWEPGWADAVHKFVSPARQLGVPVFVQITHGGASMTLLDVAMAVAARSVQKDMGVVTIEMKTSFMQPARGPLTSKGRLMHRTATMAFTEGTIFDAEGRACAHATGTFKYVKRLPVGTKGSHPLNVISTD